MMIGATVVFKFSPVFKHPEFSCCFCGQASVGHTPVLALEPASLHCTGNDNITEWSVQ